MQSLRKILLYLQSCHTTPNCTITGTTPEIANIFRILQHHGIFDTMKSELTYEHDGTICGRMCVVGTQGRFLLYLGASDTIPSIVLTVRPQNSQSSSINPKRTQFDYSSDMVRVLLCDTTDHTYQYEGLGRTSTDLLNTLINAKVKNKEIVYDKFLHEPSSSQTTFVALSDTELTVRVPMENGVYGVLPIPPIGLISARDSLRRVGCMILSQDDLHKSEYKRDVLIAQNDMYSLSMRLCTGTLKLCLYRLDDFSQDCPDPEKPPVPIVVMSHTCNWLDKIVEEIHHDTSTYTEENPRVIGMVAVINSLLRDNIPLASIKEMGFPDDVATFAKISNIDITKALKSMNLVHDDAYTRNTINNGVKKIKNGKSGDVVQPADTTGLTEDTRSRLSEQLPANSKHVCVDFRLEKSGCLTHASAHQNIGLTKKLNGMGVDIGETSIALYSGISFCHSLPYLSHASIFAHIDPSVRIHFINETDFHVTSRTGINNMICDEINKSLELGLEAEWTTVRHNFCIDTASHVCLVKCRITDKGLILFQRCDEQNSVFACAVYVVPGLYEAQITDEFKKTGSHVGSNIESNTEYNVGSNIRSNEFSVVINNITKIAGESVDSRSALLCRATKLLYYINVIYTHKTFNSKDTDTKHIHQMLRKSWLLTQMIETSKLCGGINNSEFYSIYAHLANLADQPLNSVGYWATVPYV
jgi:hypothetical protein